jgi:hypothetical protein
MRPRRLGVAVLSRDADPATAGAGGKVGNKQERRADQDVDTGRQFGGTGNDLVELGRRGGEPVHLPIASDQRTTRHVVPKMFCLNRMPESVWL